MADVPAELAARKPDRIDQTIGLCLRFFQALAECRGAEDPPTRCHQPRLLGTGAGVKESCLCTVLWQGVDGVSQPRRIGVAVDRKHNPQRRTAVPEGVGKGLCLLESPCQCVVEQYRQVSAHPHHDGLGLGVPESTVEFHDLGCAITTNHETRIEKPGVRMTLCGHALEGRTNHFAHDAGKDLGRYDRGRRIGTHAPCVGALVAVFEPLMVLAGGQGEGAFSVADHDKTRLFTWQKFFDDHPRAGRAESIAREHVANRRLRLREGLCHHHAFTSSQPIGLDHNWQAWGPCGLFGRIVAGGLDGFEGLELRRGNAVPSHKLFCEVFGGL